MWWISECTWGSMVANSNYIGLNRISFVRQFIERLGPVFLLPLPWIVFGFHRSVRFWRERSGIFAVLLLAAVPLVVLGAQTSSRDFRYYQLAFVALIVSLFTTAAVAMSDRRRSSFLLVFATAACAIFLGHKNWPGAPADSSRFFEFHSALEAAPLPNDALQIVVETPAENETGLPYIEHLLRAKERGRRWRIYPYAEAAAKLEDRGLLRSLNEQGEWFLIGPPMTLSVSSSDQNRISNLLASCRRTGCQGFDFVTALPHGFTLFRRSANL
jgi:hypothetical protein